MFRAVPVRVRLCVVIGLWVLTQEGPKVHNLLFRPTVLWKDIFHQLVPADPVRELLLQPPECVDDVRAGIAAGNGRLCGGEIGRHDCGRRACEGDAGDEGDRESGSSQRISSGCRIISDHYSRKGETQAKSNVGQVKGRKERTGQVSL